MKTKQRDHSLLYTCWSSQFLNTADMTPLFISVLLAAVCLECRAQKDNVLQPEGDVTAAEGDTVTLGCLYNSSSTNNYLFWYKQDGNNSPTFILRRFKIGEGKTEDEYKERFSSTLDSTSRSVPLKIQKLQLSDSAVYYCALPVREEVSEREGQSVTLTCNYQTTATNIRLDWYKHHSDLQAPQFILWKGAKSYTEEYIPDRRYESETSATSTTLTIRDLTLADTALY
ncbi:tyrosine-protein phosphatase non-receptor type substrate 1-like, partial [Micropterus salmoides]|uniref:tyrosine-protein phosphatase non-receptor type substrate 1-like n=1 Tax=Micropterus salmoides TaxID=27706 RepID=UPI0018EABDBA